MWCLCEVGELSELFSHEDLGTRNGEKVDVSQNNGGIILKIVFI